MIIKESFANDSATFVESGAISRDVYRKTIKKEAKFVKTEATNLSGGLGKAS